MACSVSDREARGGCGSITILRTTLTSFAPVSLRRLGSSHNDTLGRSTGTEKYETRQYFMITESRERRDRLWESKRGELRICFEVRVVSRRRLYVTGEAEA